MKLPKSRESGQTVVMALILLAVGSLMVVPMLNQSFTNLGYHQSIECRTLTSYSADAGMQYALTELYNNPGAYTEYTEEDYLIASFDLNDRTVNVTAKYTDDGTYKITSVASGGGCGSTTIEAYVNMSAGAFAFVIAAKDDMIIENSAVDDDDPDPDSGGANIHSNWNILIVNSVINGDATAFNRISISGDSLVTGIVTEYSSAVQFPGDYSALYEQMAKGPNGDNIHPGNLTITSDRPLGPLYISGNLYISGDTTVILEGTVYVTGEIWVVFGRLDGEENVVAEGYINIEGGGYGSTETIPIITSVHGDIKLEGPIVDAVVYAPNGHVWLEDVHLYGALGGETVKVERSTITYAKELHGRQDLPGGELSTISYIYK